MFTIEQFLNQIKDFSWKGIYIAIGFFILSKIRQAVGFLIGDYVRLALNEFIEKIVKEVVKRVLAELNPQEKKEEENDK